ncbi:MAG: TetR/AcrR family transcriptional regulator, partial [Turicibacter sp.]
MTLVTEDRRIRRTKKILKQSLLELMKIKKVKDITIKDITDQADLNRGTFYLHYQDIYDLLDSIENEVILNIEEMMTHFNAMNGTQTTYQLLEQLFNYIYENRDLFIILLQGNGDAKLLDKIQTLIQTIGLETIKNIYQDSNSNYHTFFLSFVSSGIIGVTV